MRLYRRHYLSLAGINLENFKSMNRRNQVPRLPGEKPEWPHGQPSNLRADEEVDAFGYLPLEFVMLGMADALVSKVSFDRDEAKDVVEAFADKAAEAVRRVEAGDTVFAAFYTVVQEGDFKGDEAIRFALVGTYAEVTEALRNVQIDEEIPLHTVSLLNLTPMLKRASRLFGHLTDGKTLTEAMGR